jgi:hypothetical protein
MGGDLISNDLYFLWSLERVAVVFDLDTIGDRDWYALGSASILAIQQPNGSWKNSEGGNVAGDDVNTSFALLFLCRANIAKDLTSKLTGRGNAKIGPDRPMTKADSPAANIDSPTTVVPKKDPVVANPPAVVEADFEKDAARLSAALISASADVRPGILAQLRDNKGSVHTEALARAAAKLEGEVQTQVREALAKRLSRMTATTLREMLKDDNREIRRGASAACALKSDVQFIPDLINALSDADALVVAAARASLRGLSGKDFGPESTASDLEKAKAIAAWKSWWATQKR